MATLEILENNLSMVFESLFLQNLFNLLAFSLTVTERSLRNKLGWKILEAETKLEIKL